MLRLCPARRLVTATGVTVAVLLGGHSVVAGGPVTVLLDGLSSPKGVGITGRSDVIVAQGAFGDPGPVLVYPRTGRGRGQPVEVSGPFNLTDVLATPDGGGLGLAGPLLLKQDAQGVVTTVLDIAAYQAADPDPNDLDGDPDGSNPYGLALLPNGDVLVADAQNNDLLRVSPDGTAVTVARFLPEIITTDHLPAEWELPPAMPAEAVPTGVAIGRDGWAYVSELKGFPFRPGSSHVYRVNPWADGATCSTNANADCSVVRSGLTALIDVAINTNNGAMYVYSLAAEGVLAFEEGFGTGVFPAAVLTEIRANGTMRELAAGQLSQPGGVAVGADGTVFATDGVFFGGRLLQVRA